MHHCQCHMPGSSTTMFQRCIYAMHFDAFPCIEWNGRWLLGCDQWRVHLLWSMSNYAGCDRNATCMRNNKYFSQVHICNAMPKLSECIDAMRGYNDHELIMVRCICNELLDICNRNAWGERRFYIFPWIGSFWLQVVLCCQSNEAMLQSLWFFVVVFFVSLLGCTHHIVSPYFSVYSRAELMSYNWAGNARTLTSWNTIHSYGIYTIVFLCVRSFFLGIFIIFLFVSESWMVLKVAVTAFR